MTNDSHPSKKKKATIRRPSIRPRGRADRDSPLTGSEVKTFGTKPGRTFKPYSRNPPSATGPVYPRMSFVADLLGKRRTPTFWMASPVLSSLSPFLLLLPLILTLDRQRVWEKKRAQKLSFCVKKFTHQLFVPFSAVSIAETPNHRSGAWFL